METTDISANTIIAMNTLSYDNETEMYVKKRDGTIVPMSFDKILTRVKKMGFIESIDKKPLQINYTKLVVKIIDQLYDNIDTHKIDELTSEQCATMGTQHVDYITLASRILISNHHKMTKHSFSEAMTKLYTFTDIHGKLTPLISKEVFDVANTYSEQIEKELDYSRDYTFDYFGFKTLERSYLLRTNGVIIERPQHMWMRVSIGIHGDDMIKVFETYHAMSSKYFTHATPTLFNAGTPRPQMSSCYLIAMEDDSIDGIYNTIHECANISKWAGGIGLHIHNIRATGSHIRGTNGKGTGIVPMLRVFNSTACYVNQGGKRNGSFAIYLEPWHADIKAFLDLRKTHGDEEARARDLFYAVWMPDLFMERVKNNEKWTLMCPDKCKGLSDAVGDDFKRLYEEYESKGMGNETIQARKLWFDILDSQIETGTPYIVYKDRANICSNQKNIGVIKSSNLCTEILEVSTPTETAVCNLASIGLSKFVEQPKLPTNHKLKIYTKEGCVYCRLAKYYASSHYLDYEVIDLSNDDERKASYALWEKTYEQKFNTMPQIFIENTTDGTMELIGGYEELTQHLRPSFNYDKLHQMTRIVTRNLNNIIDRNFYPTDKTYRSNMYHRPIGIGVQGLADVFCMMGLAFDSKYSRNINRNIFKTIYHASLTESNLMAIERKDYLLANIKDHLLEFMCDTKYSDKLRKPSGDDTGLKLFTLDKHKFHLSELIGYENRMVTEFKDEYLRDADLLGSYSSFEGSPAHNGQLQFDMWGVNPETEGDIVSYDWDSLRASIQKYGLRNSLLVAPMPTASTSQILGNNECIEPFTNNILNRRTLAGTFMVINKYLINELNGIGMWNELVKNNIIANKGSIQQIKGLPKCLLDKYRTVWEIPMRSVIDMACDRGKYICQTQSMNLWMENATYDKLHAMHMYSWKKGLKTGIYYLRTKGSATAQQFTIDPSTTNTTNETVDVGAGTEAESELDVVDETKGCDMCSG